MNKFLHVMREMRETGAMLVRLDSHLVPSVPPLSPRHSACPGRGMRWFGGFDSSKRAGIRCRIISKGYSVFS
jgi:hypothetical protein